MMSSVGPCPGPKPQALGPAWWYAVGVVCLGPVRPLGCPFPNMLEYHRCGTQPLDPAPGLAIAKLVQWPAVGVACLGPQSQVPGLLILDQ